MGTLSQQRRKPRLIPVLFPAVFVMIMFVMFAMLYPWRSFKVTRIKHVPAWLAKEAYETGERSMFPTLERCSYVPRPEPALDSMGRGVASGFMHLVMTRINTTPPAIVVANTVETGQMIVEHLDREKHTYNVLNLIVKDLPWNQSLQFIDAGSNHGLFAVDAALNSVHHVYAIEPQPQLRQRMRATFRLNNVSPQIEIFGNAVLDQDKTISLTGMEGDGGIAHIDLLGHTTASGEIQVKTTRLDCLPLRPGPIFALKIDIEGFELFGLESASGLFDEGRIQHVFVEFGPPSRWREFNSATSDDAIALMKKMHDRWGFEFNILPSYGYDYMLQKTDLVRELVIPDTSNFLRLPRENYDKFRDHIELCNELFVWWQLKDDPTVKHFLSKYAH